MGSMISAMHYCLPDGRLTQEQLESRLNPRQVRGIAKLSGILERRVVAVGQTAADLAFAAASGVMKVARVAPESVDLLIFCSQTPDYQIPATACVLHARLGLGGRCAAFDINQGCAAFPYALATAHAYVSAGLATRALVLNADTLSTVIHPLDRGLVTLHGDGACATLVEASAGGDSGIWAFQLGADGSGWNHICIPASGARCPRGSVPENRKDVVDESGNVRTQEHLAMNGPAVFQFSIQKVPEVIRAFLGEQRLAVQDLDLVLLHQANRMMLEQIYRKLEIPPERQFYFSERIGNLGGPSSAVLLAEAWRMQKLRPGTLTLVTAFGNGLSWGSVLIRWPQLLGPAIDAPTEYAELMAFLK